MQFHISIQVRNDFLDLRQPVWITDLVWMSSENYTRILTVTEHHQIRVYDTNAQKRPILSHECGEYPIRCVSLTNDQEHVVIGNTVGESYLIHIQSGKVHQKYQKITGSVTSVYCLSTESLVAITSIDRFLRIYQLKSGKTPLAKFYLKQRLSRVQVNESLNVIEEGIDVESSEEENEELMWSKMKKVQDQSKRMRP